MRFAALCLTLVGLSQFANAALIERDLTPDSGDHSLTFDSRTGFEWLDVTLTQGRSFAEVTNGWGGWIAQGFRIAYRTEVDGLIESAGLLPNNLYDTYPKTGTDADIQAVKSLSQKLGITFIYEDQGSPYKRRSTHGYIADGYSASPGYENFGRYADIGFYELGWTTRAWAYDGSETQVSRNSQYGDLGTFLVRADQVSAVPEPSVLALLLAGLGVLGLVKRTTRQTLHDGGATVSKG
jgi:hypothetical protein